VGNEQFMKNLAEFDLETPWFWDLFTEELDFARGLIHQEPLSRRVITGQDRLARQPCGQALADLVLDHARVDGQGWCGHTPRSAGDPTRRCPKPAASPGQPGQRHLDGVSGKRSPEGAVPVVSQRVR
jgi:hypothetical protein